MAMYTEIANPIQLCNIRISQLHVEHELEIQAILLQSNIVKHLLPPRNTIIMVLAVHGKDEHLDVTMFQNLIVL